MPDGKTHWDEVAFLMALAANRDDWDGRPFADVDLSAFLDATSSDEERSALLDILLRDPLARRRLASLVEPEPLLQNADAHDTFIGRQKELDRLTEMIRSGNRWVTVTGPGGIGKSRLVHEAAQRLSDSTGASVSWMTCANFESTEDLNRALARNQGWDGDAQGTDVARRIGDLETLLVLDDLPPGVRWNRHVAGWIERAPRLQVVVTSRSKRGHPLESELRVVPLSSIDRSDGIGEALQLFLQALRRLGPDHNRIPLHQARVLCRRLSGMPLAIGLAAGCLADQSPESLISSFDGPKRQGPGIKSNAPTIERVVEHALAALSPLERNALIALTAFAGAFSTTDAASVSGNPTAMESVMQELRSRGLLQAVTDGARGERWQIHAAIASGLTGPGATVEDLQSMAAGKKRHAALFSERASEIGSLMIEGRWREGWDALVDANAEFRRAVAWAETSNDGPLLSKLSDSLARSYFESGYLTDFDRLASAASRSDALAGDPTVRIKILGLQGALASRRSDEDLCGRLWTERLELSRIIGDAFAETDTLTDLAWRAYEHGDLPGSLELLEQARMAGEKARVVELVATAHVIEAKIRQEAADPLAARSAVAATEGLLSECRDRDLTLFVFQTLARVLTELGEHDRAATYVEKVLSDAFAGRRAILIGWALRSWAPLLEEQGDRDRAAACYVAATAVHNEYATKHLGFALEALRSFQARYGVEADAAVASARTASWEDLVKGLLAAARGS